MDAEDENLAAELLELGLTLADRAAALLVEGLAVTRAEIGTKTTATDMVTEIDRASEALILDGILTARPDDSVLAEEGGAVAGRSRVRWVVDPVDGTTNYLYGHPGFAVSIAAQVDGETVVGVVHDPLHGDVFSARKGHGAFRNGEPIRHSGQADLGTALVATGFAYDAGRRRRQADVLTRVLGDIRDVRRMGAASVDLCWVACGRVDAYYERGLGPWDWAAGLLVAVEAGVRVGALDGTAPVTDSVLAAPPPLFDALSTLLTTAGAADA